MSIFKKILAAGEGKKLKTLEEVPPRVNALEPETEVLDDAGLRRLIGRCRGRRPKASEERTRGKRRVVCRLWGFCRAAASARNDFSRIAESGMLPMITNWPPLLHLAA